MHKIEYDEMAGQQESETTHLAAYTVLAWKERMSNDNAHAVKITEVLNQYIALDNQA